MLEIDKILHKHIGQWYTKDCRNFPFYF